jgi:hypothetical protein
MDKAMQKGSCHCGGIRFDVEGTFGDLLECNCSHCQRKGYLLWFVPKDKLTLTTPPSAMGTYKFNKHVLDHHFCPTCGCAPFSFGTAPDGTATAAINVRCLEGIDLTQVKRIPYDGRSA